MKFLLTAAAVFVLATGTQLSQQAYAQDAYAQKYGLNSLEMLCVVNLVRERVGLDPLRHCDVVATVAARHSVNMDRTGLMEHSLSGLSPFDRLRRAGVQSGASGENIAKGQETLQDVMQDWIDSCGHYDNIVNPSYNEAGFGRAGDSWTQDFVSLSNSLPTTAINMDQCRDVVDFSAYSFAKADRCSGAPRPVRVVDSSREQVSPDTLAPPPPAPQEEEEVSPEESPAPPVEEAPPAPQEESPAPPVEEASPTPAPQEDEVTPASAEDTQTTLRKVRRRRYRRYTRVLESSNDESVADSAGQEASPSTTVSTDGGCSKS